jgi:hypothetical protein
MKPIVATDADGLLDVLTDRKDASSCPRSTPAGWPMICELLSIQMSPLA